MSEIDPTDQVVERAFNRLRNYATLGTDRSITFADPQRLERWLWRLIRDLQSDSVPPNMIAADATLTIGEGQSSHFACPQCARRVSMRNAYPLSFHFKRCPGCQLVWVNSAHIAEPREVDTGLRADSTPAGATFALRLVSTGEPVR